MEYIDLCGKYSHRGDYRPVVFDKRRGETVRQYAAVMKAHFLSHLQYRAAAWAGIGTQLFFGMIKVMIFTGFFQSSLKTQPMTYNQVINYLWLGQALLMILPFRADRELAALIRTGNVAYELSRPVDLYKPWQIIHAKN